MSIKISQLPSASAVTSDDLFAVVDDVSGSPITRKATAQQVLQFVTSSNFDSLNVDSLSANNIQSTQLTASDAQIDNIVSTNIQSDTISASSYVGLPDFTTPGGPEQSIQFNSGSTLSGSNELFFDYNTSTLSGVTAQFTTISASIYEGLPQSTTPGGPEQSIQFNSGSELSGSDNLLFDYNTNTLSGTTAQFTTLSASVAQFSDSILVYGTAALDINPDAAYIVYSSSIDKLVAFPGLYTSGSITASSDLSASSAFFVDVNAGTISASTYEGLPQFTTPGGPEYSIQFNSGSELSGSSSLIYNYDSNILSGTTAQFTTLSASTAEFSGNVLIYGTASLDSNPEAAYVLYSSSIDKIVIYPGVLIDGDLSLTTLNSFDITASNISITDISSSTINSDTGSITYLTASNISASLIEVSEISSSAISASLYIGIPEITLSKTIIDTDASLASSQRAIFATNAISSSISLVLPSVSSADSREYYVIKADSLSGSVFVSASVPELINGQPTFELNGPYQAITLISNGTNWFIF